MIPSAYNRARRAGVAAALGSTGEATYSKRGAYPKHRPMHRGALPLRRVWLAAYERTMCRENARREPWWNELGSRVTLAEFGRANRPSR